MKVVTLKAEPREPRGTAGARRTRREAMLPAVIYGEGKDARHIKLDTKSFQTALASGVRVIDLEMDGVGGARVLLKDVQWDALGAKLVHADFLRLNPDRELELNVPITFDGTPAGVLAGGILNVPMDALPVRCLPGDIPEGFTIRIADLALGDSIYARDIPMPERVELVANEDDVIVTILAPRGAETEAAADGDAEGEPDGEGDAGSSEDSDEG